VMLHEKFHSFSSFFNYFMKRKTRPKMTLSVISVNSLGFLTLVNSEKFEMICGFYEKLVVSVRLRFGGILDV
jgi:hypothetical protein